MKTKMLSVLMFALCLAGCQRNSDDPEENKPGQPTGMSLIVNMPRAPLTYSQGDGNATDAEVEMKKVNVLIYQELTPGTNVFLLESNTELLAANFDLVVGTTDTYQLKDADKIVTSIGKKKIYVAMNYEGDFPATGASIDDLPNFVYTLSSPGVLVSNGIAMFSNAEVESTLVKEDDADYATNNTVGVTVKRMVAKVTLQEHAELRNGDGDVICMGGKMTNLQFAVGNANKTTFLFQKVGGTAPDRYVQDNNWSTFDPDNDFTKITDLSQGSTEFMPVDNKDVDALTANAVYIPENTAEIYELDGKNLSYLLVRAQFTPARFLNGDGSVKEIPTTPVSFWTVTSGGQVYYFNDNGDALGFRALNPGSVLSAEYVDGFCYYRVYLNSKGVADGTIADSKANKFDVLRNHYYKLSIKSISSPGEAGDMGEVTIETNLNVEVTVQPWQAVEEIVNL